VIARVATAAALAAATLAAAGCGSADDGFGAGGTAPTKADAVIALDALCRQANADLAPFRAQLQEIGTAGTPKDAWAKAADVARQAHDVQQGYVAKLDAVAAPAAGRATLDQWRALTRQRGQALADLSAAFSAGQRTRIRRLTARLPRLTARASALARAYGLRSCGRTASGS
jgi:hypothetical protein